MCGILGTYDLAISAGQLAAMSDAIAHRGPDAAGDLDQLRRRPAGAARAPAAVDHRPVGRGQPAVRQGRAGAGVLRRDLQLPGAAGRAAHRRDQLPHRLRHRGAAGGVAPLGSGEPPPPARHVRLRAVRRARGHAHPGPRPVRHQAAVLDGAGRRRRLLLRAEGTATAAGRPPADRPHRHRRLADVLLDSRGPLRLPGCPEAPARELAAGRPGRPPAAGAVLRPARRAGRAVRAAGRRGGAAPRAGGLGRRAPGGRRADLHVPVRRAGLQPAHRPGRPPEPRHRQLHDLVPAGGPAPGGDAGRPRLRPQAGRPARHQAARGRDRPRRGRPAARAWCTRWTSRSATPPPSTPT